MGYDWLDLIAISGISITLYDLQKNKLILQRDKIDQINVWPK